MFRLAALSGAVLVAAMLAVPAGPPATAVTLIPHGHDAGSGHRPCDLGCRAALAVLPAILEAMETDGLPAARAADVQLAMNRNDIPVDLAHRLAIDRLGWPRPTAADLLEPPGAREGFAADPPVVAFGPSASAIAALTRGPAAAHPGPEAAAAVEAPVPHAILSFVPALLMLLLLRRRARQGSEVRA